MTDISIARVLIRLFANENIFYNCFDFKCLELLDIMVSHFWRKYDTLNTIKKIKDVGGEGKEKKN